MIDQVIVKLRLPLSGLNQVVIYKLLVQTGQKKLESKGFTDELKVSSATEEFYNFLLKEAY